MAGKIINIKICSPFKINCDLKGKSHAICHYSYMLPMSTIPLCGSQIIRKIIAYKNYFVDFYKSQEFKLQEKIEYVFDLVRFEKQVPKKIL